MKRNLSLREFARIAGMTPAGVRYHIDKGHIKTISTASYAIPEDQLEVIKKFSKESKKILKKK